jgi:hypothetical protein
MVLAASVAPAAPPVRFIKSRREMYFVIGKASNQIERMNETHVRLSF